MGRGAVAVAVVALAVTGAFLLAFAGPAPAAAGLELTVDGTTLRVDAAALRGGADVAGRTVVVDGRPTVIDGTSLRRTLELASADPDAVSAVTFELGDALVQLLGDEFGAASVGAEGAAVLWVDDQRRTNLLRPSLADGDRDRLLVSAPDQPLAASIEGTSVVQVSIVANTERATVGEKVPLRALSTAESPRYTWDFGDGTTASGKVVTHAWKTAGRFRVTVRVSGVGGGGVSEPVVVIVGAAARKGSPSADAPSAAGSPPAAASPSAGSGSSAGADPSVAADTSAEADPAAEAARSDNASATDAAAERRQRAAARREAARRRAAKRRAAEAARRAAGADPGQVSGTLLASADDPAASPAIAGAVAATRSAAAPDQGQSVPGAVWLVLGLIAITGAGAALQLRGSRRSTR